MMDEGSMMCGFQPDHGLPNHWRFIIPNPRTTEDLIDAALDIIARCVTGQPHARVGGVRGVLGWWARRQRSLCPGQVS